MASIFCKRQSPENGVPWSAGDVSEGARVQLGVMQWRRDLRLPRACYTLLLVPKLRSFLPLQIFDKRLELPEKFSAMVYGIC